eukprot:CAMPEP_0202729528 /NCGR_PEP_ID=MMETSP1385-20130828/186179_1 /ASSEMBLY_ACC=CAM_ASM_000861 /TAXON_ID=933848 /ORGANISM="Elphidium margaritaceum" /LENGTH=702 /DNA_ID=CAMNT_0049395793 /DNA_START=15 /DNA_END=2123 /DNA_ORIENTATION=-
MASASVSAVSAIQFRKLAQKIIKDPKNLPNLPKLIRLFKQNATQTKNAILWLQRIFVHFNDKISFLNTSVAASADNDNAGDANHNNNKGAVWMKQQYAQFEGILMSVLQSSGSNTSTTIMHDALKCLLFFAKLQNHSLAMYNNILFALLCKTSTDMTFEQRSIFITFAFEEPQQSTVNHNALQALAQICRLSATQICDRFAASKKKIDEASNDELLIARFSRNLLQLLLEVSHASTSNNGAAAAAAPPIKKRKLNDANDAGAIDARMIRQQRSNFVGMAWLNYLSRKHLSIDIYHTILSKLDSDIFAVFKRGNTMSDSSSNNNLLLLADFLTDSYNIGGEISMLSLKALFTLIHSYNLDYPHFYERLYGKLHGNIFFSRNATKFFQLLSLFLLKSDYIPQYLVVAFMKRLSRMSLFAPPHGVIFIVNIVRDLLRKYPAVRFLVDKSRKSNQGLMHAMKVNAQQKMSNAARQEMKMKMELNADDEGVDEAVDEGKSNQGLMHAMKVNAQQKMSNAARQEMKMKTAENDEGVDEAVDEAVDADGDDGDASAAAVQVGRDPFDYECLDPKQCRANESSLWELKSLINHFEYKTSRHCFETVNNFQQSPQQQDSYRLTNINKSHMFQYHKLLNYYFMKNEKNTKSMKDGVGGGGGDDQQKHQKRFHHKQKHGGEQEKKKYNTHDISVQRTDHLFSSQSLFTDVFAI